MPLGVVEGVCRYLDAKRSGFAEDTDSLARGYVVGNPGEETEVRLRIDMAGVIPRGGPEVTYSAAKVLRCIRRSSTSFSLWTRNALWPEGIWEGDKYMPRGAFR